MGQRCRVCVCVSYDDVMSPISSQPFARAMESSNQMFVDSAKLVAEFVPIVTSSCDHYIIIICVLLYSAVWIFLVLPPRQNLPGAHHDLAERTDSEPPLGGEPEAGTKDAQSDKGTGEIDNGTEVNICVDHFRGIRRLRFIHCLCGRHSITRAPQPQQQWHHHLPHGGQRRGREGGASL